MSARDIRTTRWVVGSFAVLVTLLAVVGLSGWSLTPLRTPGLGAPYGAGSNLGAGSSGSDGAALLGAAQSALALGSNLGGVNLPPRCAGVHPSDLLPLRLIERQNSVYCASASQQPSASPSSVSPSVGGWRWLSPTPPPMELYDLQLTYDSTDHYVLLFGATGVSGPANGTQTWRFTAGNWTLVHPVRSPESCIGSSLADDPVDHYVVYLGGAGCPSAGQTWTYSGGNWTHLAPAHSPPVRQAAAFTNDSKDGYLVLFGGINAAGTGVLGDTWKFVRGNWTKMHPTTSPGARTGAGMTYDASDGYVVMFGGSATGGCPAGSPYCMLNDTWSFKAGVWSQITTPGLTPPEPYDDGLVYDSAMSKVLYTVTDDNNSMETEIYWSYHAGAWTNLNHSSGCCPYTGPPNRLGEGLAYDWADQYALMYGGTGVRWNGMDDSWAYQGGVWKNLTAPVAPTPTPRYAAAMTYDAAIHSVLLFGGANSASFLNDSWLYANGSWTRLSPKASPPARSSAGMVYDAADREVVLFGGDQRLSPYQLSDTWVFVAGNWKLVHPTTHPAARDQSTMTYDAADAYVLLFGGGTSHGLANDTWSFANGTWVNRTAVHSPHPVAGASLAYDAADGYSVLFGGIGACGQSAGSCYRPNDTWSYRGGVWTNLTSARGPPSLYQAAMTYDPGVGAVILFSGYHFNTSTWGVSYPPVTYEFLSGVWTNLTHRVAPPGRAEAGFAYDARDGYALLVGGYGTTGGALPDFWRFG